MDSRPNPLKRKREIRDSMEKARRLFNSNLQKLIGLSCKKNQTDDHIQNIKEIFTAISATEPSLIITKAGPYIWKYKEELARRDEKFFIENTFEKDVATFYGDPIPEMSDTFTEDDVSDVMKSLKRTWHLLNKSEKTIVWNHGTELLRAYAQYLGCEKKLHAINIEIKNMNK